LFRECGLIHVGQHHESEESCTVPWDDNDAEARVVRGLSDDEVAVAVGRARARLDGAHCRLKTMNNAPAEIFDLWYEQAIQFAVGNSDRGKLALYLRVAKQFEEMARFNFQNP
jgi:hypothetical protein